MMNDRYRDTFIIKLGGSLIVPPEGIAFLSQDVKYT